MRSKHNIQLQAISFELKCTGIVRCTPTGFNINLKLYYISYLLPVIFFLSFFGPGRVCSLYSVKRKRYTTPKCKHFVFEDFRLFFFFRICFVSCWFEWVCIVLSFANFAYHLFSSLLVIISFQSLRIVCVFFFFCYKKQMELLSR